LTSPEARRILLNELGCLFWCFRCARGKDMNPNPCLHCGACCALFRVSFYWAEMEDFHCQGVPLDMVVKVNDFLVAMKGTERRPPRCTALTGAVGQRVFCTIYDQRPSPCREFEPSWQGDESSPRCDQARLMFGLEPLSPDSWRPKRRFLKAA
jgi:Fe-S-cluster containining protein